MGKISGMTAAAALTGVEQLEVVQTAATRRTTAQAIADLVLPSGSEDDLVALDATGDFKTVASTAYVASADVVAPRVLTPPSSFIPATMQGWVGADRAQGNRFTVPVLSTYRYVRFSVGVSSGNIQVAVIKNTTAIDTGSPYSYTRVMDSGLIACPAAGAVRLDLGGTVLDPGDYFLCFWADNTTVQVPRGFSDTSRDMAQHFIIISTASGVPASGSFGTIITTVFLGGFTLEAGT